MGALSNTKVSVFAGGVGPTLCARILPLAKALESYRIECKVIPPIDWRAGKGMLGRALSIALTHPLNEYVKVLRDPPEIVIVGRTSTPQIYLLQKLFKRKGIKTIFDLDDPLFLPTTKLFGVSIRNPGISHLERVIKDADAVTVDNHFLLKYVNCFNKKAFLVHVPVDTDLFHPKLRRSPHKLTIGWQGSPRSHYENLAMLVKPLEKLAQKYNIRFKIASYLGDMKVKHMFKKLESVMEVDYGSNRWLPLEQFAKLLSDFDIMVAPLKRTPWYEGKSVLRVSLGMAMGISVVASPVGEQKHIIIHGTNGFLAQNEEEWYTYLRELIENNELRRTMGKEARETAEKELSLHVCGRKLYSVIKGVLEC